MAALFIIFAKEPLPGQVKTRLCPPLAAADAARLYQCFLEDILEEMGRLSEVSLALAYANSQLKIISRRKGEPGVLLRQWANTSRANTRFTPTNDPLSHVTQYFHPTSASNFFGKLSPPNILLFPQEGADLSARLVRAFDRGFAAGFETVLIRNSDSPDLPGELILEGKKALETGGADLVLGPSPDGGYYLVGLKKPCPPIFQGIPWSTPAVLAATQQKARELSLAVHILPAWPDIDTIADLRAFAARPFAPDTPGRRSHLYARKLLASLSTKN